MKCSLVLTIFLCLSLSACNDSSDNNTLIPEPPPSPAPTPTPEPEPEPTMMVLESVNFEEGDEIPILHACTEQGGNNASPNFAWTDFPDETATFALIMDDEVSPCGSGANACKHWALFNIPSNITMLDENIDLALIEGAIEGLNWRDEVGYTGPCPPNKHTYKTTIYALDDMMPTIEGEPNFTRSQFTERYEDNILATATLSGVYTP